MSDVQPGTDDIIVRQGRTGYLVGEFANVSSPAWCDTYLTALQLAHRHAARRGVDVWYAADDAMWRVQCYRPIAEFRPAASASRQP
jgi:hypothetical protein